ncbi:MAG: MFS transporter [Firmicutes bacterium]|jgi:MFS family permease|nr:MFS transporter [Bacillota bacterium]
MNYSQNVWKLYGIRFFHNLIPAYVIERLFWEQRGMTIQLVVFTEILYAATIVLFEVPSGIAADKWGRKKMMIVSALMGCCEFLILLFASSFWHFAAAIFLAGIGRSAGSGAENALLYDSLLLHGNAGSFEKCFGRLSAWDFSAAMLAALSGSLMANWHGFELNYWVSFAGMAVSLLISLTLVEPEMKSKTERPIAVKEYVTASVRFFQRSPGLCLVLLSGMVVGAAMNFIDEFWQLYINRIGVPVIYFGLFSAGLSLLRLPGNILAYKLKNKISYRALILGVVLIFAVGMLYLSAVKGYTSLAVIFLIGTVSGIMEPLVAGYLHHSIDSSMRATIDSFRSLGLEAVLIIVGLGFGFFSSRHDVFGGYGFISLICFAFLVYFLATSKHLIEQHNDKKLSGGLG